VPVLAPVEVAGPQTVTGIEVPGAYVPGEAYPEAPPGLKVKPQPLASPPPDGQLTLSVDDVQATPLHVQVPEPLHRTVVDEEPVETAHCEPASVPAEGHECLDDEDAAELEEDDDGVPKHVI
jgi:hypothetical protein